MSEPRLVVSAFWIDADDRARVEDAIRRAPKYAGSGDVITMTPKQVKQPGVERGLRAFHLEDAVNWQPTAAA